MTVQQAIEQCRQTGRRGWELVEYAQKLVAGNMRYSWFNSFDMPGRAFEWGMGYCWQQAGALNGILKALGIDSRLVYTTRVQVPCRVIDGVSLPAHISGHVWCRVRLSGEEKDVCPGSTENSPGVTQFQVLGRVRDFRGPVWLPSYLGSAFINWQRGKEFMELKEKQAGLYNPETCPCKKAKCPRSKNCAACREYHHAKGSKTTCERKTGR